MHRSELNGLTVNPQLAHSINSTRLPGSDLSDTTYRGVSIKGSEGDEGQRHHHLLDSVDAKEKGLAVPVHERQIKQVAGHSPAPTVLLAAANGRSDGPEPFADLVKNSPCPELTEKLIQFYKSQNNPAETDVFAAVNSTIRPLVEEYASKFSSHADCMDYCYSTVKTLFKDFPGKVARFNVAKDIDFTAWGELTKDQIAKGSTANKMADVEFDGSTLKVADQLVTDAARATFIINGEKVVLSPSSAEAGSREFGMDATKDIITKLVEAGCTPEEITLISRFISQGTHSYPMTIAQSTGELLFGGATDHSSTSYRINVNDGKISLQAVTEKFYKVVVFCAQDDPFDKRRGLGDPTMYDVPANDAVEYSEVGLQVDRKSITKEGTSAEIEVNGLNPTSQSVPEHIASEHQQWLRDTLLKRHMDKAVENKSLLSADEQKRLDKLVDKAARALTENEHLQVMQQAEKLSGKAVDVIAKIQQSAATLAEAHGLNPDAQIDLASLRLSADGKQVHLDLIENGSSIPVSSDDVVLRQLAEHLENPPSKEAISHMEPVELIDASAWGFAIQTIMGVWTAHRDRHPVFQMDDKMRRMQDIQAKFGLAIAGQALLDGGLTVAKYAIALRTGEVLSLGERLGGQLAKLAERSEGATASTLRAFSRAAEQSGAIVGAAIGAGMMGLDIWKLTQARSQAERAIYGVQLGVDTASTMMSAGAAAASLAGASAAAASLSAGGVLVAGLGIGVAALAEAFQQVRNDADKIGNYFANLKQDYQHGGCARYSFDGQSTLDFRGVDLTFDKQHKLTGGRASTAVITSLDFGQNRIGFDSQGVYRADLHATAAAVHTWLVGHEPYIDSHSPDSKKRALNVREKWGLPAQRSENLNADITILPCEPKSYINYSYGNGVGFAVQHDRGFDDLRELASDSHFWFNFYLWPSEYAITRMSHEYVPTTVQIKLDDKNRTLITPDVTDGRRGKIGYEIQGQGGQYVLSLQQGVRNYTINASNKPGEAWVFQFPGKGTPVFKSHNVVSCDGIDIHINGEPKEVLISNKQGDFFTLDMKQQKVNLSHLDAKKWGKQTDTKAILAELDKFGSTHTIAGLVQVDNMKTPSGHLVKGWVNAAQHQLIYLDQDKQPSDIALLYADDKQRFFYSQEAGKLFLADNKGALIKSWDNLKQARALGNQILFTTHDGLTLRCLSDKQIYLESVNIDDFSEKVFSDQGKGLDKPFEDYLQNYIKSVGGMEGAMKEMAPLLKHLTPAQQKLYDEAQKKAKEGGAFGGFEVLLFLLQLWMCHRLTSDPKFTELFVGSLRGRYQSTEGVVKIESELTLGQPIWYNFTEGKVITAGLDEAPSDLVFAHMDQDNVWFYSPGQKQLYIQEGTQGKAKPVELKVATVFNQGGRLFAHSEDGLIYQSSMDNRRLQLTGIGADWIKNAVNKADKPLATLTDRIRQLVAHEPSKADTLTLVGVPVGQEKTVTGWWRTDKGQVVLPQMNSGDHLLNYVGNNGPVNYILDTEGKTLYCQTDNDPASVKAVPVPEGAAGSYAVMSGDKVILLANDAQYQLNQQGQWELQGLTSNWYKAYSEGKKDSITKLAERYPGSELIRIEGMPAGDKTTVGWFIPSKQRWIQSPVNSGWQEVGERAGFYYFLDKGGQLQEVKPEFINSSVNCLAEGLSMAAVKDDTLVLSPASNKHIKVPAISGIKTVMLADVDQSTPLQFNKAGLDQSDIMISVAANKQPPMLDLSCYSSQDYVVTTKQNQLLLVNRKTAKVILVQSGANSPELLQIKFADGLHMASTAAKAAGHEVTSAPTLLSGRVLENEVNLKPVMRV